MVNVRDRCGEFQPADLIGKFPRGGDELLARVGWFQGAATIFYSGQQIKMSRTDSIIRHGGDGPVHAGRLTAKRAEHTKTIPGREEHSLP